MDEAIPAVSTPNSPFKFLDIYSKEDGNQFFGRDQETSKIYDLLIQQSIVLVYGPSGVGKTSVISAGLFNKMDELDHLPVFIRRISDINSSLRDSLSLLVASRPEAPVNELLHNVYRQFLRPILLVFDQLEELVLLGDRQEQEIFAQSLAEILDSTYNCKIILLIREDFLGLLDNIEKILPSIFDNRVRIAPMSRSQLRATLLGSTRHFGIQLEDEVAFFDEIFDNLRNQNGEIELVQLQIYLDQLYRNAVRQNPKGPIVFDRELIQQTGSILEILSNFFSTELQQLQQQLVERRENSKLAVDILGLLISADGKHLTIRWENIVERFSQRQERKEAIEFY